MQQPTTVEPEVDEYYDEGDADPTPPTVSAHTATVSTPLDTQTFAEAALQGWGYSTAETNSIAERRAATEHKYNAIPKSI